VTLARDLLQLLWRVRWDEQRGSDAASANTTASSGSPLEHATVATLLSPAGLPRLEQLLSRALVAHGPWRDAAQLPRTYVQGVSSRGWHSIGHDYPQLRAVEALLKQARASLLAEWRTLVAANATLVETECIAELPVGGQDGVQLDASRAGVAPAGWRFCTVNAHWLPPDRRDADGCALGAPVACNLLRSIANLPQPAVHSGESSPAPSRTLVRVLRGGYSAIAPGTRLRPHCGMTNSQVRVNWKGGGWRMLKRPSRPRSPLPGAAEAACRPDHTATAYRRRPVRRADGGQRHAPSHAGVG